MWPERAYHSPAMVLSQGLVDALQRYHDAVGAGPLPGLPSSPVEAVCAVFTAHPFETREWHFGCFAPGEFWPSLVTGVGDPEGDAGVGDAALGWAFAVGQMQVLARAPKGGSIVVDTWPNDDRDAFVFEVERSGQIGRFRFDRLAPFVSFAAALVTRHRDPKARVNAGVAPATKLVPAVMGAQFAHSAMGALPWLMRLNPAVFFRACRRQGWPEAVVTAPPYEAGRTPLRSALVWSLVTFLRTRRVTLAPGLSRAELTAPMRETLAQLEALEAALVSDTVPPVLRALAEGDGPFAAAAQAWVETHRALRQPTLAGAVDVSVEGARFRAVYDAIEQLVDALEAREAIEIVPQRKVELVEEIMRVWTLEDRPKVVLGAMTQQLVDSECVAEVFVDDAEIEAGLRLALGL